MTQVAIQAGAGEREYPVCEAPGINIDQVCNRMCNAVMVASIESVQQLLQRSAEGGL